ncbi:MAG TPA: TlpA disulfide reductase family protein [Ferruginibacter sp.]|nr:TlpA disulfide reductase family protein [Ferruginibacter sp.]
MIKKIAFTGLLVGSAFFSIGQSIPKWKIEDVVRSFSAKSDTVYVVNFWATFCKPCNEEIPDFIRLTEKYKNQKVKLMLVSLDLPSYVPERLPAFIKKNKYNTNHVWLNETNADHFCPMIDQKWSGAIPATIIVNNKTGYRKFTEDQISAADFEKTLKEALGGK